MRLSWLVMVASAIADTVMTVYNIGIYGIEIEGNPVLKYVIESIGPLTGILLFKIIGIAVITYVVNIIPEDYLICGRWYIKNKWFFYVASIAWFYGAFSHILAILIN